MKAINKLKLRATEAAKFRGHVLIPWQSRDIPGRPGDQIAYSTCRKCLAGVCVRTYVAPNEIDIGGSAVAINCKETP